MHNFTRWRRLFAVVACLAFMAAACSDSDGGDTETAGDSTTTTSGDDGASPDGAVVPTSSADGETSEASDDAGADSTTPEPTDGSDGDAGDGSTGDSGVTTTLPESSTSRLDAGQPATWFAVRDEGSNAIVEERDSATDEVRRELGRYEIGGCIEEGDDGECEIFAEGYAPVSIDVTTDRIALGFCCEPVSGGTDVLQRIDGVVLSSTYGSEPAFAPAGPLMITSRYSDGGEYSIINSNSGAGTQIEISPDWGDSASWSYDGTQIAVEVGGGIAILSYDPELGEIVDVSVTLAAPEGATWSKPAFQSSGNLVVAQDREGGQQSVGVVLNGDNFGGLAAGDLVLAEFLYEGVVVHQSYDDSGMFLIYVLNDGSVRWQGRGQIGTLALPGSGHVAAAW